MTITGKVNKLVQSETAYGVMHNIEVDGKTYGCGKFPLKGVREGDYISFDAIQKGRFFQVDYKTVQKLAEPPASAAGPSSSPSLVRGPTKGYYPEEERQKVISRQAARNAALTFVQLAQAEGALEIPKTAKAGAKFDLLLGIVDEITERFNAYAMTGKNKDVEAEDEPKAAGAPDDSWEET